MTFRPFAAGAVALAVFVSAHAQGGQQPQQPQPQRQATQQKLERMELLELRDLAHQVEVLRLRIAEMDRTRREAEKAFEARVEAVAKSMKADPKRLRLNMETGEVAITQEVPSAEKP